MLVVEVDGDDHRRPDKYAADRYDNAQRQGCMVLRYTNQQVLSGLGLVVDELRTTLVCVRRPMFFLPQLHSPR